MAEQQYAYGLLGEKLGHSYSPQIHHMLGDYPYALIPLPEAEAAELLRSRRFLGLNVTIPYKRLALKFCDQLSPAAQRLGNVNTLVHRADGSLWGDNTDYTGFLYMARQAGISFAGRHVLVLGTGGASMTVQAAVADSGAASVTPVSRSGPVNYDTVYQHQEAQIIVNTTPVGMYPHNGQRLVDLKRFPQLCGVLDLIYNPLRTRLILDAQALGIPCASGLSMLVAQAKYAGEQFMGRSLPDTEIQRIHSALLRQEANLILIGMPGSGKTQVGTALAKDLGRPFWDMDAYIVDQAGMSIPAIFEKHGEARFRDLETQAAEALGKKSGQVIACGGGTVLRPENVDALRQNGALIRICRPVEKLSRQGRPLSTGLDALREMEAAREPFYAAAADRTISNTSSLSAAVQAAKEAFYEVFGD